MEHGRDSSEQVARTNGTWCWPVWMSDAKFLGVTLLLVTPTKRKAS